MKIGLTQQFKKDFEKLKSESKGFSSKVLELIISIESNPTDRLNGIGKPELLKGNLAGCLSRRISSKHRLIYEYSEEDNIILISCYGHYNDK